MTARAERVRITVERDEIGGWGFEVVVNDGLIVGRSAEGYTFRSFDQAMAEAQSLLARTTLNAAVAAASRT